MDSINVTFGLFGTFLVWMAIDQLLIFQFDTSMEEEIKNLYNWLVKWGRHYDNVPFIRL